LTNKPNSTIAPADGKLGVLIPGMGAVTSAFIAGVEAVKRGLGLPIGSLTQMGTVRLGKRTEGRTPKIKDFVPLAPLDCLAFGGWDIYEDNSYEAAVRANVLERSMLDQLKEPLSAIKPMKAVFDHEYVKRINGPNVKTGPNKMAMAEALMQDIQDFKARNNCNRLVMIWCGSTEVFRKPVAVHQTLAAFEEGLRKNDPNIAPSQIYAYAALRLRGPFANGAPNLTTDTPALQEGSGAEQCSSDLWERLQNRPDVYGDLAGTRLQGAHAGRPRLVFHQYLGQPRRRSVGRPGFVQIEGRNQTLSAGTNTTT
jgi:myo-inositol-1-phosphate synthase